MKAIEQENKEMELAREVGRSLKADVLENRDTPKQQLVRSRYLLFKEKWTANQRERADILFALYPVLGHAYRQSMRLSSVFTNCRTKEQAFKQLALWYNDVEDAGIDSYRTVCRSMQAHYLYILNFFNNRNTNTTAESFNAKIKAF